jgi:AcrR family transcriptional regulator
MTDVAGAALARIGRRERKRAALRIGLLDELRTRIESSPFEQITIRGLADALDVSEPTVFAQFPTKRSLLTYHIHVWRIGAMLAVDGADEGAPFLQAFFARTADDILLGPRLWFEISAEIARGGGLCEPIEVGDAERLLAFADERALGIEPVSQRSLFAQHVQLLSGPNHTKEQVLDDLLSAFYGVPLALGQHRLADLHGTYRRAVESALESSLGAAP